MTLHTFILSVCDHEFDSMMGSCRWYIRLPETLSDVLYAAATASYFETASPSSSSVIPQQVC